MTAKITENDRVVAAPAGRYGFGTLGLANPERTLDEAWRMVQRAGLTRYARRETAHIKSTEMHTVSWVEYETYVARVEEETT